MQPDPVRVAETRAWLEKAQEDLRAADLLLTGHPPLLGHVAYACQQAAEKALKGYLLWRDRPFRKTTHDLSEIGRLCLAIDPSLRDVVSRAQTLTDYAWKFRYPGPDNPLETEVREALALAREVYASVLSRLPAEVRP